MCNRYRLKARPDEVIEFFGRIDELLNESIDAEYFPGKIVPVVHDDDKARYLARMTWGFPPFRGKRPINLTRSETAATSSFWKRHLGRRCVFPLSEAIEWQHQVNRETGETRKVPYVIRFRDYRLAAVAGIYSRQDGIECCSMMTCAANQTWASIHNADPDDPRMVCFLLDKVAIEQWLNPEMPFNAVRQWLNPVAESQDLLIAEPLVMKQG